MKKILIRSCLVLIVALTMMISVGCSNDDSNTIMLESGQDYCIKSDVNKISIKGDANGNCLYDICITIAERENDLTIILDNVNFVAKDNRVALLCKNTSYKLTVKFKGQCTVKGGDGSDGNPGASGVLSSAFNWCGSDGKPGQPAVKCGQVVFETVDNKSWLVLKGGSGGNGGDAGNSDLVSALHLVTCKPNGGNGGDGAPALICTRKSIIENDNLSLESGSGGWGGSLGYCRVQVNIVNIFWNDYGKMYGADGKWGESPQAVVYS